MDIVGLIKEALGIGRVVVEDVIKKDKEELYRDAEREAAKDINVFRKALRNRDLYSVKRMFEQLPKAGAELKLDPKPIRGYVDNVPGSSLADWYGSGRLGALNREKAEIDRIFNI